MKFNDVKRFSTYVRTKYHSEYITIPACQNAQNACHAGQSMAKMCYSIFSKWRLPNCQFAKAVCDG